MEERDRARHDDEHRVGIPDPALDRPLDPPVDADEPPLDPERERVRREAAEDAARGIDAHPDAGGAAAPASGRDDVGPDTGL